MNETIYIIGSNALSCFLAARFTKAGEKVTIISDKNDNIYLSTTGITLKDPHSLQKDKFQFETSFWIKDTPKAIIICSDLSSLNALLTTISPAKINQAPVVLFSQLKEIEHIKKLLGTNVSRAFFNGFVSRNDQTVIVHGKDVSITICERETNKIFRLFKDINLETTSQSNEEQAYNDFFNTYALSSLLSTVYNKPISEAVKQTNIQDLLEELASIGAAVHTTVNPEGITKKLYNTPSNYFYPLHKGSHADKIAEINLINNVFTNFHLKYKTSTPQISKLIKEVSTFIN